MLGTSGGRSANNRTGEGATRRNTPRERTGEEPPWDQMVPRYRLTPRGELLANILSYLLLIGLGAFGGLIFAAWFGLL